MIFARITIVFVVLVIAALILIFPLPPKETQPTVKGQSASTNNTKPSPYPIPKRIENSPNPPAITAKSSIVVDVKSGVTIFEKDPNTHLLPASTTKLLTALVALEKCPPDESVTIGLVDSQPSSMGLSTGDTVTIQTLLSGLLIASGNDAALALSYSCAVSTDEFVHEMNLKAQELGMFDSHFTNPAGFDHDYQYSTAHDLAQLARIAVANPLIAKIVATKSIVLTDIANTKTYYLENVNKLLGQVEGIQGIKTGQTTGSLEVLITQTTRNGHIIITVVLGSKDRFADSVNLIEWAFANYHWVNP